MSGASCNTTIAGNLAGKWTDAGSLRTGVNPISSLPNAAGNGNGEPYWAYDGREEGPEILISASGTGQQRFQFQSKPIAINYQGEAWLGVDTRGVGSVSVQCIAIYQDPTPDMNVQKLAVQFWTGAGWSDHFTVDTAWAGSWMRRPRVLEQYCKLIIIRPQKSESNY